MYSIGTAQVAVTGVPLAGSYVQLIETSPAAWA